jgi:hypothetical protein
MKKNLLPVNINPPESVNLQGETILEAAVRIENDPAKILALVDLIFGFEDNHLPPS